MWDQENRVIDAGYKGEPSLLVRLLGSKAEKPERCGASESQTAKFGRYSNTVRGLLNKAVDEIKSAANVEEMMMKNLRYGWDLFRRRNARNDRVL
jgi:hypothetical protein